MSKYGYGVDVGGTTAKIGRFTVEGELIEKWEVRTNTDDNGKNIIPNIAASVEENIAKNGIAREDVVGIGMGVPGPVHTDGTCTCVNLFWDHYAATDELSSITGFKVKCANDANAASLGEYWQGSGKGHQDVVMVTLGTGVGAGIIIGGKIHNGAHGAAGEIGHLPVNPSETKYCNCGNRGCLEQYASANGNVYVAETYLSECDTPSPLRTAERINSKLCWDLAIEGDPVAVEIANRFSNYLGIGLASLANSVDPEIIILGGGVSRTGEPLRAMVEEYFKKYAFNACKSTPIVIASLGNDAGMYGCVKMLLDD